LGFDYKEDFFIKVLTKEHEAIRSMIAQFFDKEINP